MGNNIMHLCRGCQGSVALAGFISSFISVLTEFDLCGYIALSDLELVDQLSGGKVDLTYGR